MIPQEVKDAFKEGFRKGLQKELRPLITKAAEFITNGDLNNVAIIALVKANTWVDNLYAESTSNQSSSKTN